MNPNTFEAGQRWVSNAEPELGLGLILEVQARLVRVIFPAVEEERAYAISGAPLSRLRLAPGDVVRSEAGWEMTIEDVAEEARLVVYGGTRTDTGEAARLAETRLAHDLQVDQPRDRLLTNQFDTNQWFEFRHETLKHRAWLEQSDLRGLLGARISAIPHQLYIAHEVSHRHAPRVLLADEVGLGKTIEAGLILHHQLLTERAQRALLIVPQALISQWVLELMRRFNLNAAIFDEERSVQAESSTADNPFDSEQLVVCSLDFLLAHPHRADQVAELHWDLMVVDEAHHLRWSPDAEGAGPEYRLVERLAASIPGLLLLTATPEQLGYASHFARLRLLDPDRFDDLDRFVEEQTHFVEAAREVDVLLEQGREDEVQALLDRHGTGRVLFRNTRAHVQGFARRDLHPYPLENPYTGWSLYPENEAGDDWLNTDPRVAWLLAWLRSTKQKALVICAHQATAVALEHYLNFQMGIRSAAFHEGLGLLARDRAAAWFAEDDGAQALICSEIGSEGRNFQFAQHLVLFDLPTEPDLLEQRIGRLDRIGQRDTVHIHVPYLLDSPQEVLFRWYHEGLGCFEHFSRAGSQLRALFADELESGLSSPQTETLADLIDRTRHKHAELNDELERGRDRLLELGSCRDATASALRDGLLEHNNDPELTAYLDLICDCFGIEAESYDDHSLILRPATNYEEGFKDISLDGTSITTDRATALAKEDFKFLSWEHPLITEAMDRVLGGHRGNTAVGVIKDSPVEPGTLMLECLFLVTSIAPASLQLGRYLPPQLVRIVVDNDLEMRDSCLPFSAVQGQVHNIGFDRIRPVLQARKTLLESMLARAHTEAERGRDAAIAAARRRIDETLRPELDRLQYLKSINPNVRDIELEHMAQSIAQAQAAADRAQVNLAGVRVLIAN